MTASAAGGAASATITGTAPNQTLNLTIPRGDQGPQGPAGSTGAQGPAGPANTLAIGTVTASAPGGAAAATITGTAPNQTLNLTIPRGDQGPQGPQGTAGVGIPSGGSTGQILAKASATNFDVSWINAPTGGNPDFIDLPDLANVPAAPVGAVRLFGRARAGRVLPHFVGPAGPDTSVQPALFANTSYMWLAGTGTTAAINWGVNWTARNAGTGAAQAHPTKASTNALTSLSRATFSTGTTAVGSSGIQSGASVAWRGNAENLGGFFFFSRFSVETHEAAMRYFIGLSALNAALNGEPSAQANTVGIGKDSTDSTWQIITRNASTVTKTNTGAAITAGQILDFLMFARPNGSDVTFRLVDAVTGTVIMDDVAINTNLPVNTTFLFAHAQCQSTVGTTAKLLALNRIYVETDL